MWFSNKCKDGHKVSDCDVLIPAFSEVSVGCVRCKKTVYRYSSMPIDMRLRVTAGKLTIERV